MGSEINIELEHKVLARYNLLIQNKMLSKGACRGVLEVLGLLQNSLFENSDVNEQGTGLDEEPDSLPLELHVAFHIKRW